MSEYFLCKIGGFLGVNWYFTADLHIDHPWMSCTYRGFTDQMSHDDHIIKMWNDTVDPGGVVVVAGDIFWHDYNIDVIMRIWNSLNGNKIIVKGNHDRWLKKAKLDFRRIYEKTLVINEHKQHFVACHYPMGSWNRKKYGAWNLHGHSHGKYLPVQGQLDIGVDNAKFLFGELRPFTLSEVNYLLTGETYE